MTEQLPKGFVVQTEGVDPSTLPAILIDRKCKKCFGRGYTGTYDDGTVVPCTCMLKETKRRHKAMLAKNTAP